ncbi:hypothetical protein [Streptomyces sp. NPDC001678]|uniref:hypothetical protein n=1 Tax=Streptomyces sp. NPDC001678 TaxID=3364599 RepID=UPI00369AE6E7
MGEPTRALVPAPAPNAAVQPPCAQCHEIKQKRYAAVRQGDRRRAEAMATAMGRHQRAAH